MIFFFASIKKYPEAIVPGATREREEAGAAQRHHASHTAVRSILACFSLSWGREIKRVAWILGNIANYNLEFPILTQKPYFGII